MAKKHDVPLSLRKSRRKRSDIVDILDLSSSLRIIRHVKKMPGSARYARVEKCLLVTGHNHEDAVERSVNYVWNYEKEGHTIVPVTSYRVAQRRPTFHAKIHRRPASIPLSLTSFIHIG